MIGMYNEKVMDYFMHPRNVGEMKKPDGVGRVGNVVCGDVMQIHIKVTKKAGKEIIKDIKFKTYGCAAAIATSSMVTDMARGKTLDEAMKITRADVSGALGKLPPIKEHCSNLAADALHAAIENYRDKSKGTVSKCTGCTNEKVCGK